MEKITEQQGWLSGNLQSQTGQFNVYRIQDLAKSGMGPVRYNRRDFYKISLYQGTSIYHYADKSLEVSGSNLLFFSPKVPYTLEKISGDNTGYFCIFTEDFFKEHRINPAELPMFRPGSKPFYALKPEEQEELGGIYRKMLKEIESDYLYKYDLIRNYVIELIHFALKLQPSETIFRHPDANSRLTSVFTELLERQFPIESTSYRFDMRSAGDFAGQLSVHVNHLNRAIRSTTGKTTTHHINGRLYTEAKALLKHTNWNISEIAWCLGFEEAAHFNNFFRKHSGTTPTAYRLTKAADSIQIQ